MNVNGDKSSSLSDLQKRLQERHALEILHAEIGVVLILLSDLLPFELDFLSKLALEPRILGKFPEEPGESVCGCLVARNGQSRHL